MRSILQIFLIVLVLAGCSSGSFVGRGMDNFTAYYNTFFNAEKSFRAGVKAVERQDQPVDRNRYMGLFTVAPGMNTPRDFEDAIKKGADILRDHPDSKWLDDALMVIGKSYYYQQNFVGAEQKFREVIDIASPHADEARFWLARSLIAGGSYDTAAEHLLESLHRDDLSRRWQSLLHLALGELYVKSGQWDDAALELEQGLERVPDKDLGARAQFLLGQVYERLGRYEDAVAAFDRVRHYRPLFELLYAAQVSAIRVRGAHGDAERALRDVRRMERDDKNFAYRADLAFLRGWIYQAQNQPDDAYAIYHGLLYDSATDVTRIRGRIHYALAELYRDAYLDYVRAAAHFDTASVALAQTMAIGQSDQTRDKEILFTPAAIYDFQETANVFKSFATVRVEVDRLDSLLHLGSLGEEEFRAAVQQIREQRAREAEAQRKAMERRQVEQGFRDAGLQTGQNQGSVYMASTQADANSGFLFHRNQSRVQENWFSFLDRWGERPHVPNWRRREAINALAQNERRADGSKGMNTDRSNNVFNREDFLPPVDISTVPRDSLSRVRMREKRAAARYELANILFLALGRPDSAAAWYRRVIDEDADQPVAQRAYYAFAEVHRSLADSAAARRLYEQTLEAYPNSDFADQVRERLGIQPGQVRTDSSKLAEEEYAAAYREWQRGAHEQALNHMLDLAVRFPSTTVVPRALLAAGSIFTEWVDRDSTRLFEPLPVTLPDSVLASLGITAAPDSAEASGPPAAPGGRMVGEAPDSLRPHSGSALTDSVTTAETITEVAPGIPETPNDPAYADTVGSGERLDEPIDTPISTGGPENGSEIDTLLVAADDPAADTDTLRNVRALVNLETLYAGVASRYPETPYAQRATSILEALKEKKPKPSAPLPPVSPADTTEVGATPVMPDTIQVGDEPDAPPVPTVEPDVPPIAAPDSAPADTTVAPTEELPQGRFPDLRRNRSGAAPDTSRAGETPPELPRE